MAFHRGTVLAGPRAGGAGAIGRRHDLYPVLKHLLQLHLELITITLDTLTVITLKKKIPEGTRLGVGNLTAVHK